MEKETKRSGQTNGSARLSGQRTWRVCYFVSGEINIITGGLRSGGRKG